MRVGSPWRDSAVSGTVAVEIEVAGAAVAVVDGSEVLLLAQVLLESRQEEVVEVEERC